MCDTKSSIWSLQESTARDGDAALKEPEKVAQSQDCKAAIKRSVGGFCFEIYEVAE